MSAILRKTVRIIKHLPRRFSRAPGKDDLDSQREEVLSKLWVTYEATRAMGLDEVLIDPEQLARLGILTLPLDLTGDTDTNRVVPPALNPASYFVPLTDDYIREHPVDLSDSVTAEWFNDKAKALDPEFRGFGNEPMSSYDAADQLSRCLRIEMSSSRLNCEEETQKLTWLNKWRVTGWSNLEPVFEGKELISGTEIMWYLEALYVCRVRSLPPHVKAILSHSHVDNSEPTLLKAELKVIIALMYSRWSMEGLLDMIVPVFLLSFIGRNVRCSIAIHDGTQLRISKSPLYPAKNSEVWQHVVRHMGGRINEKLDTKTLPVVDEVEE
ncbi:uncharacterized protein BP01DRAFT_359528 [Aspergillus saccharolyticus JOP 1030-1]|uniref:Uncharacterized protein n=1 Tax=Aspergillus saccharolyticus JOP 1030-1 TaxID=1450539 RepID=A0A318Z599_9EURO|nr:hypothetical protein BP01DRAFT_359528 [Aspergillus saccharolyticus JOP 1030-1]PYH42239.1 hypothetical protein BP01DRAFT_359528 [Aspergillus saccharolyticus JOP 1030-1]